MKDVRKLVRVEEVTKVEPAPNSDRLDLVHVGGWQIVGGRNEIKQGDKVVFAEIDSMLPIEHDGFNTLPDWAKNQSRVGEHGVKRYLVRTAKIRGNLSQGIVFPVSLFPNLEGVAVGTDVTRKLGVTKFEPPASGPNMTTIGGFPENYAMKSDAERVQNLERILPELAKHKWAVTEKLDGTSITVLNIGGEFCVAGRSYMLDTSSLPEIFDKISEEVMGELPEGWALQGELLGPAIQNNRLNLKQLDFRVYAVYNMGRIVLHGDWPQWAKDHRVPVVEAKYVPGEDFTIDGLIEKYDGMESLLSPGNLAEGVVLHQLDDELVNGMERYCFKVVSNEYLLKHGV